MEFVRKKLKITTTLSRLVDTELCLRAAFYLCSWLYIIPEKCSWTLLSAQTSRLLLTSLLSECWGYKVLKMLLANLGNAEATYWNVSKRKRKERWSRRKKQPFQCGGEGGGIRCWLTLYEGNWKDGVDGESLFPHFFLFVVALHPSPSLCPPLNPSLLPPPFSVISLFSYLFFSFLYVISSSISAFLMSLNSLPASHPVLNMLILMEPRQT